MTHFIRFASAALLAAWSVSAAGVDPELLALLAPDSKTVAGIEQNQSTPLGQTLFDLIQPDPAAEKMMAAAGFDPRRDLREILAGSTADLGSGSGRGALLAGRGSFQPAKIIAAGVAAGAASSAYRGVPLLEPKITASGSAPGSAMVAVAFPDNSTVLAGEISQVKAAIDRRAARTAFSGELAVRARQLSTVNDVWIVSAALPPPSAALTAQLGPVGNLLQAALQISAGLKIGTSQVILSADILARTPKDAQAMVDIVKFGIQMLASSQTPGPGASSAGAIVQAARISAEGSTLHAILPLPEQLLQQFLEEPSRGQPKRTAALGK